MCEEFVFPKLFGRFTNFSDCAQITDGAALLALASGDYAREYQRRRGLSGRDLACLSGRGFRVAPLDLEAKLAEAGTPFVLPWTKRAIAECLAMARLEPGDLDVIETHDCFTVSEYLTLSHFGIADPGREYEAVEDGRIAHDGSIPVNPSGGLIGAGHPVGASGVRMALDLFKQVTGRAGECQVEGAKNGAMLNVGGSFTTNISFAVQAALDG